MKQYIAILEIWIKSSKSIAEVDRKISLIEKDLFRIKEETKRNLEKRGSE